MNQSITMTPLAPARFIRRLAWTLCAAILIASVGYALIALQTQPLQNLLQAISFLTTFFGFAVFGVTGALIISHQPRNPVGWLLMSVGALVFTWPIDQFYLNLPTPPAAPSAWFLLGLWFVSSSWLLLIFPILYIPLFFPTGRPPSHRWRWLVVFGLGLCAFFVLFGATMKEWSAPNGNWMVSNPIGVHRFEFPMAPWAILLLSFAALSVASLFVRYRRASAVEREQIKWLLYAACVFFIIYSVVFLLNDETGQIADLTEALLFLGVLLLPIAIAIAILRHKLYDIDIIIRKTLVYTALTALLALVYFGGVVLLQRLFGALTGVEQSPLAVVVSTLAIAALFTPLRRRIQDALDRRFFRKKYDAQRVLAQFALTARDETDLDALTAELARVVQETLQPERVSVWLKKA